jgi:hypothetical protein
VAGQIRRRGWWRLQGSGARSWREQPATREKTTTEGWEAEREDKIGSDTKLEWKTLTLTRVETGIYILIDVRPDLLHKDVAVITMG